jgi:hypothetical protein
MPLPFLPLLGAAARGLAGRGMASLLGGRLWTAFSAGTTAVDVAGLARRLGTPKPSQEQIKAEGQRLASEQFIASARKMATTMTSVALLGPAAFSAAKAVESFGAIVLERRRGFAMFNSGIAQSFARMERQSLLLGVRTGAGISPSTQGLARAFMALREDMQPLTEVGLRIMNVVGTTLIQFARLGIFLMRPATWLVEKALDLIDKIPFVSVPTETGQAALQGDLRKFFREISRGNFGNPINQRPGRDQRLP